ncbi:hypothetical protein PFISCL1PPCAC_18435 [Pristionchus fissidentatus]|uniref:Snx-27 n=1 Tax=Pristionchus fissidentatus TaxID=1538716 RepID=A0AAV5W6H3_9BILA|nr:hypothetical protein PFISCL1PPCAC_18435 [Pristionchus fissidentatus]
MYDESDDSSDEYGGGQHYRHPPHQQSRYHARYRTPYNPKPHLVTIVKSQTGFGFNVKGQVSEGGQLRSINGDLYAPLQHVSAVLPGGAAERAGLRKGDRILEVNGANVEGATHKQVVQQIKNGGDRLEMVVISVEDPDMDSALRYECGEDLGGYPVSSSPYRHDYSECRSLPITIPSYKTIVDADGQKYTVFNVHMAGRHLGSRRYSDFVALNSMLRAEFIDFSFPKLPGKWPFSLSDQQMDARRRGLEQYLERICSIVVIADSEMVQEFLMESEPAVEVEVRVLLPDQSTIALSVRKTATAACLFTLLQKRLELGREYGASAALFETMENNFDRKLAPAECVHQLYIHNYSSSASSCIVLRKWLFDVARERELCARDAAYARAVFYQTVAEINYGKIRAAHKMYQLKALQSEDRMGQYMELARSLPGYATVAFPVCAFVRQQGGTVGGGGGASSAASTSSSCSSTDPASPPSPRQVEGRVVLTVSYDRISLREVEETVEIDSLYIPGRSDDDEEMVLEWEEVHGYKVLEDGSSFILECRRRERKPRLLKLISPYADFMALCFAQIEIERDNAEREARAPSASDAVHGGASEMISV